MSIIIIIKSTWLSLFIYHKIFFSWILLVVIFSAFILQILFFVVSKFSHFFFFFCWTFSLSQKQTIQVFLDCTLRIAWKDLFNRKTRHEALIYAKKSFWNILSKINVYFLIQTCLVSIFLYYFSTFKTYRQYSQ